ncbi:polysaccharide pyruvyl transferase family protein [Curtobacterium sp. BRD11]|uniref:polysaccharide pyruvyl transferase family protein n=1 Tax=Curtobacterium sp. BRD11 TaxID=2962581 RepID=UPI00288204CE|nr:polysaccharide pyruvyl transferase family protein [Curtobacterium sp. BRD11]MDT0211478.1 polysaccharide pyruvyl transferase family protein [Curtobacterium sp. BRD11]
MQNFGDLLGPLVVRRTVAHLNLVRPVLPTRRRLVAIGSVIHLARNKDVIWGAGVNGKMLHALGRVGGLDVRAVRGPRTRERLLSLGVSCPPIYGDPALLIPHLMRVDQDGRRQKRDIALTHVPNLNDRETHGSVTLDPRSPLEECIDRIRRSELVVGSSLHGVIIAEAFGVPAVLIAPKHEDMFKYEDYYGGTGRTSFRVAASIDEAVKADLNDPPVFDPEALLGAFPADLWRS